MKKTTIKVLPFAILAIVFSLITSCNLDDGSKFDGKIAVKMNGGITKKIYKADDKSVESEPSYTYFPESGAITPKKRYANDGTIHLKDSDDFQREVLDADGFVFVDFYRGGCPNCYWSGWSMEQLAKINYSGVKYCNVQAGGTNVGTVYQLPESQFEATYMRQNDLNRVMLDDDNYYEWVVNWLRNECRDDDSACEEEFNNAIKCLDEKGVDILGRDDETFPYLIMFYKGEPVGGICGGQPYWAEVDTDGTTKLEKFIMGGWDKIGMKGFIDQIVTPQQPSAKDGWTIIEQNVSPLKDAFKSPTSGIREFSSKISVPNWFFGRFDFDRDPAMIGNNSIISTSKKIARREFNDWQFAFNKFARNVPQKTESGAVDVDMNGNPVNPSKQAFLKTDDGIEYDAYDIIDGDENEKYGENANKVLQDFKTKYCIDPTKDPFLDNCLLVYGSKYQKTAKWGEIVDAYPSSGAESNHKVAYYIADAGENFVTVAHAWFSKDGEFMYAELIEVRKGEWFDINGNSSEFKSTKDKNTNCYLMYNSLSADLYMYGYFYMRSYNRMSDILNAQKACSKTKSLDEISKIM